VDERSIDNELKKVDKLDRNNLLQSSKHFNYYFTLCFDNGLQFNPAIVHVDFELAAMKVLKEIF
jgi:hypothetical protein